MKDIFGKALVDFLLGTNDKDIITSTSISENDTLPLSYLFRDYNDMPIIEKKMPSIVCQGVAGKLCNDNKRKIIVIQDWFLIGKKFILFKIFTDK